jgi:hypothetical protein
MNGLLDKSDSRLDIFKIMPAMMKSAKDTIEKGTFIFFTQVIQNLKKKTKKHSH